MTDIEVGIFAVALIALVLSAIGILIAATVNDDDDPKPPQCGGMWE